VIEEWRDIPGAPEYEVSNHGRVRRWPHGRLYDADPRYLRCNGSTYPIFETKFPDGSRFKRPVHILVLEVFMGPRPAGFFACHFPDKNYRCARLDNLRWDSAHGNGLDQSAHNLGGEYLRRRLDELRVRFPHLRDDTTQTHPGTMEPYVSAQDI
jgi:hypothetical protein